MTVLRQIAPVSPARDQDDRHCHPDVPDRAGNLSAGSAGYATK
jgi:hypothetical protein